MAGCEWETEGGKELLWMAIWKGLCEWMALGLRKRAAFSAHVRQCKNEKTLINQLWQHFSTMPKLTCNNSFQISLATVSLQKDDSFSKLRNLASDVQQPFRTDSNPHRRYAESLQFPARPVT